MTPAICYYLKNSQCIPVMSALHSIIPGCVIANKAPVAAQFIKNNPGTPVPYLNFLSRRFFGLRKWDQNLKNIINAERIVMGVTQRSLLQQCLGQKIMVFHGTFRYITAASAQKLSYFDMTWVNSPRQARMLDYYHNEKIAYQLIGYLPFLDFPDKTPASQTLIRKKLNLHPNHPVVVYLPARRLVGSWCKEALNLASQVTDDIELILRPHPNQLSQANAEEQAILESLKRILQKRNNIYLDTGLYAYNDLLCVADLVISDATSPAEESLYYDVPQLFTQANSARTLEQECLQGGMPEPEIKELLKLYDCGIDLSRQSFNHWGDAITAAITQKDKFAANRRDYFVKAFGDFSKTEIVKRLKDAVL